MEDIRAKKRADEDPTQCIPSLGRGGGFCGPNLALALTLGLQPCTQDGKSLPHWCALGRRFGGWGQKKLNAPQDTVRMVRGLLVCSENLTVGGGVTTFSHVPQGAWSHTRHPSFSPKTSTTCAPVMVALRAL